MNKTLQHVAALIAVTGLAACASYPPKVDCGSRLRPINLPPPPVAGASSSKAESAPRKVLDAGNAP